MDENNVNGFDNMDDEEGTTVLTSPGVSAFGGAQGTPPTNMTTPDQNANQAADQMNGQYGAQQYGDQANAQYGQQYGDQMNGQYGQQYDNQMNGQYGQQQYGDQMNGQYGQQYGDQTNSQYGQQQYGDQANGQYDQQQYWNQMNGQYGQQQYGAQMNDQYGQQQYGGQMNGQYGQQQYGGQMGNNPFAQPAKKPGFNINDFFKNTKLMIISGASLAAIIIIIVVIAVAAGGRGAGSIDKIGDKLAKAVRTENENTVYKLMNSKMFKAATEDVGETKKEALDDIQDLLEDDLDDLEDEVGKVKKIEVKDVDKSYSSKSDIKDLKKEFKKEYDVDLDISGYAYARADITVEGEDGTADGTLSYSAVKIGSKWYLAGDYNIYLNIDYDR